MAPSIPETLRVLLPGGVVRRLPLEEYVRGVVAAALPADAHLEALKAQAVAARTFGAITRRHIERGSDVCTLRHCQVWKDAATASALKAVDETRGIVAVHNGRLIDAYYFEHCDGNTRDATGILIQVPPYLQSVSCPCGFATLKGHGIGMCQRGAQVMARFGDTYDVILKHYFNGITLDRAGVISVPVPEPPLSSPTATRAREPEAPSQVKTRGAKLAPRPGRARKYAAPSPTPAKPIDYLPSPPPTADIPPLETAKGVEILSARHSESTPKPEPPEAPVVAPVPILESTLQTESRETTEIVPATPTPESALRPETQEALEVLPAPPALESKLEAESLLAPVVAAIPPHTETIRAEEPVETPEAVQTTPDAEPSLRAESLIPPEILPPAMASVESALPAESLGTPEIALTPLPESALSDESQVALEVVPTAMQSESALRSESQEASETVLTPTTPESTLCDESPVAPELVPTPMQSGSALRSESQQAPEIFSTPPPPVESELRAESPMAPEVVSTPTSTQSPTHVIDLAPVQVNTATTQEQAYLTQAPGPATTQAPPRPSAATAIGAPLTLEAVSTPMPSDKVIPEVEAHDETELVSSPQPAGVTFQIESTESPPVSSSPAAAATPTLFQPERTATPPEPAPDLSEDELIWYPTAEEIVLGAGAYEAALIDEALEALEETQEPSDLGTAPISDEALTPPTGGAVSNQMDSASPAPVEELIQSRPPESVPEQMPDFPVESLAVEPQAPLPPTPPPPESMTEQMRDFLVESQAVGPQVPLAPPPLHEEDLLDNQSAAPPSQVLIDRLPGPRMIVGDLAKPGIIITIRDAVGHAVVLVSGAAPHHGPGGFEAPLTSDGTYDVTFDHHALQVHLTDETIFLQLSS